MTASPSDPRGPRLVLASQSPRRADILRQLGVDPIVRPADVDETRQPGEDPAAYVERLARAKAEAIDVEGAAQAIVIGGDTVVVDGPDVLSKPEGVESAVTMLCRLSGRDHHVLTGIALVGPSASEGVAGDGGNGLVRTVSAVVRTRVSMRHFDEATARAYVETGEPLDKAGGYGIQGQGAALVGEVTGDYNAVVGFPVGAFLDLLGQLGWRLDFDGTVEPARS